MLASAASPTQVTTNFLNSTKSTLRNSLRFILLFRLKYRSITLTVNFILSLLNHNNAFEITPIHNVIYNVVTKTYKENNINKEFFCLLV